MRTDASNRLYLGGSTTSRDMPFDKGFDTTLEDNGLGDGFVARVRLEPDVAMEWGSYVGGTGDDIVFAIQFDKEDPNRLYIGGRTSSDDLMTPGKGFDTTSDTDGSNWSMFLLAADMVAAPPEPPPVLVPVPVSPLGWSCGASVTSGGPGVLVLGVLAGLALLVSRRKPRA
ncbi:MAG TPA: MYXO-CTERM sorting domain-containing protein [Archangium sp.]|nr:MYXO-CTERM sorting domain-containing protein [Archangium sp.]